jgi:threonine dehydrogenase-like Zn-dependent dehydrogenase
MLGPVAEPAPGPGEAMVRTRRVAVWRPARADLGAIPGRDFVGVIDRLHDSADAGERRRLIGRRVVGLADIACTRCDLCRGGLSAHCRDRRTLGEAGAPGCLAERFAIPVRNLAVVPESVPDDRAVFALALAEAVHAAQQVRLEGGAFVTVVGDGVPALLCAQVLAARTPAVRVLGGDAERLALCEKWGVKHRHQSEAGRRRDQSAVVECTGAAAGFALATGLVRPRGTIVLAGGGPPGADLTPVADSEVVVVGARSGPLRDALALLAGGSVDVLSLVGRRLKFEQAPSLRADGGLAQLVEF